MNLKKIFEPESLAVFGISRSNPQHPSNVIYNKNHLRHRNRTYAVNPNGGSLYGDRLYESIAGIPEKVDLAVIGIKAEFVPGALRACIEAGVGGAIVISGGFAEVGRKDLQEEIRNISVENGFPVIGPNCLGVFSPPHVDAFFLPPERLIEMKPGDITLISQSGGILIDIMIRLTQEGVGIARAVSIGNKAAIDEVDLVKSLQHDPATRVIGLYVEGFLQGRGRDFAELLAAAEKPVVFMKSGKTPGGSKAVSSHTASMAGDYRVLSDVLGSSGAIEAGDENEFVSFCEALSVCGQRCAKNVCVVTTSGGHGAIAADEIYEAGLNLCSIPAADAEELRSRLSPSVRPIASLGNPVDLTGSSGDHDFIESVRFLLHKDYVDSVVILMLPYIPAITPDVGARIAMAARDSGKPVITYMPRISKYEMFYEAFENNGIPVAHSVANAVSMAKAISMGNPASRASCAR